MTTPEQKKWRLLRSYLSGHPIWCTWQVTYRCNFRCRFCSYWRDPLGRAPEQSPADFARGAKQLARWGSLLISLAGGEPLLRKDLPEVIEAVSRWHFPFVTTNGYLATPQRAKQLFQAGLWGISVSLDYADAARHDKARGVNGAYERALQALEIFSSAREHSWQRVNLMAVLMDDNLDQVEPLIQLAAERDAYFMIQPYSELKNGETQYRHDSGSAGEHLLELRRKYGNFLSNPSFLANFDRALSQGVPGCAAGRAFFNIDSTGDIAICVERRQTPIANLYKDDINHVAQRLKHYGRLNQCQACWYNCRGEVESLYKPVGLLQSLPTLLFDRGRPSKE